MKTLQEDVEVAKEIYEKADKIMEILKDKVKTNEGNEKIYQTVQDVPPLKSKGLEMMFYNKDLIIKKCIETFEDGNGHSNMYIYHKDTYLSNCHSELVRVERNILLTCHCRHIGVRQPDPDKCSWPVDRYEI